MFLLSAADALSVHQASQVILETEILRFAEIFVYVWLVVRPYDDARGNSGLHDSKGDM